MTRNGFSHLRQHQSYSSALSTSTSNTSSDAHSGLGHLFCVVAGRSSAIVASFGAKLYGVVRGDGVFPIRPELAIFGCDTVFPLPKPARDETHTPRPSSPHGTG